MRQFDTPAGGGIRSADFPLATPTVSNAHGVVLTRAADRLWRVVTPRGRVIGHLQAIEHPLGLRYRARRFHSALGGFRDVGDFWSADEAVSSLRAL